MKSMPKLALAALMASAALPGVALAYDQPPASTPGGGGGGGSHSPGGSPTAVPEPGTIGLLAGGLVAAGVARRFRRKR
jgi:hypothetical protein